MASESHRRKKAATTGKRAKKVNVVLLKRIPSCIPKRLHRNKLKKDGHIINLAFHQSMTSKETMELIIDAFKELGGVDKFQFLQGNRDNTVQVHGQQELDGNGVLNLARCGSLYVQQVEECDVVPTTESESRATSSRSFCENQLSSDDIRTKQLLQSADRLIKELRVSVLCHTHTLHNSVIEYFLLVTSGCLWSL